MLKRVIKDLVLENAYLCDEVAQVHEDILTAKEERRFLLKKLQHLEVVAGIDSSLQPVSVGLTTSDGQPQQATTKKAVKRKAPQEIFEEVNGSSHSCKPKAGSKSTIQSKVIKSEDQFEADGNE